MGVYDFAVQTISTTSSTTGTTKNWTYTVTFINKTTDQSINEDAKIDIEAILHKEPETFCELNPDTGGCKLNLSYNPSVSKNVITLEDGYIYYHDENLTNGAGDYSYRYAGANPNNYICFGSEASTCPTENIYRIIGLIPVEVVINDQTNPVITETQSLYKIVKNDYINSTELGAGAYNSSISKVSPYAGPGGNQPSGDVQGFCWSGSSTQPRNTWSSSTLNSSSLNGIYLTNLGSTWSNKIAKAIWKVGGGDTSYIVTSTPMSVVYTNEIAESGQHISNAPTDGKNEFATKVGLIYVSDYGYAVPSTAWGTSTDSYNGSTIIASNWLYKGVYEWTITRSGGSTETVFYIDINGSVTALNGFANCYRGGRGVRPTFYLTEDTIIDMTNHAGTLVDPYRISN
jgi:hypothetical protein